MRNGCRVGQAGIAAAQCRGNIRVQGAKAFDVQFANQALRRIHRWATRCGREGLHHDGFQGLLRVVARVLQHGRVRAVA